MKFAGYSKPVMPILMVKGPRVQVKLNLFGLMSGSCSDQAERVTNMQHRKKILEDLSARLAGGGRRHSASSLLRAMAQRADRSAGYGKDFDTWLETRSELHLRIAVAPFGDYWENQGFKSDVDALDEATKSLKEIEQAPEPCEMDGPAS